MSMPMPLHDWSEIAAIVSAMVDVILLGKEVGKEAFNDYLGHRRADPSLPRKAAALASAFSTYSPAEVDAINGRIMNCRKHFIDELSGPARRRCLCSVFRDVKEGNGGTIPDPEWERAYEQLNCAA